MGSVGRNKLAQFRQPYAKCTATMPELRKLVPAYLAFRLHPNTDTRQQVQCDRQQIEKAKAENHRMVFKESAEHGAE